MSEHNLVVLRGTLAGEPRLRELSSGSLLSQFDITTRDGTGTASVPVAWVDPPPAGLPVEPGGEVVVVGRVNRRFFRAGGATQSRTEVVADHVVPATERRQARRALAAARTVLDPP